MKQEVAAAIDGLRRQFDSSNVRAREDGQGGAYVVIESVTLTTKFVPTETWVGFHIPAQYPYADIYPVFTGNIRRANGAPFSPPVTLGHTFEGRAAIQISRKNSSASNGFQKASAKILKVIDFLEKLP